MTTDISDKLTVTLTVGEWLWLTGLLAPHMVNENRTLGKLYAQIMDKIS